MSETYALACEISKAEGQLGQRGQDGHQPARGIQPLSDAKPISTSGKTSINMVGTVSTASPDLQEFYVGAAPVQHCHQRRPGSAENRNAGQDPGPSGKKRMAV